MKNNSIWNLIVHSFQIKKLHLIMKISFLLLFACLLQVTASTYSQTTRIDLNVNSMKVKDVLKEIESKTNFRFFYNDELSDLDKTLSLNAKNENISVLLKTIFANAAISYKILENNVVIIAPAANFQQQTVSGKVTDASNNEPLVGVTVMIEGTSQGTTTDADGKFSITASGNATLVFSYIGYNVEKVAYTGQSTLDISLIADIKSLEEVVVVGYGTVKKRDLTGSVTSIKANDVTVTPTNNVMEALQGKIAGMDIQQSSGAVGSDATIRLRGIRSIYGSNDPLYIVDGVNTSYNQINPSDIETIDVLKDASSTAIYGSAGSNGVVIITTKRGNDGKAKINLDAYYGFSGNAYFKHGMTGDEYTNYMKEAYRTINGDYPTDMSQVFNNSTYYDAYQSGKWIDWVDKAIGGHSTQQKYNLSISGGTEKTKLFTSFNVALNEGLLKNENQDRYGLRINLDQELFKWAKTGTTINFNYNNKNARSNSIFTKCLAAFPLGDPYDENGNINAEYIKSQSSPLGDEIADQYVNNSKSAFINPNVYLELKPLKSLTIKTTLGATISIARTGKYLGKNATSTLGSYATPVAQILNDYNYAYTWDNIITYDKTFNEDHHFTLTGVTSWSKSINEDNSLTAVGQELDSYSFYNMAAGTTTQDVTSSYVQNQSMSFAGRINYSYKGKYLLSVTDRYDGVSHLASGHKWDNFPAAAIGWRVSDENFMEDTKNWLDNLKLRIGYGVTGNSGGIGAYASQTQTTTYENISIGGSTAAVTQYSGYYTNSEISWEKSYNFNAGIDLSFYKSRIDVAVDLYNTRTKDLIFLVTMPATNGVSVYGSPISGYKNVGETLNKGFEFTINTKNIQSKSFKWNSTISFTHNINEVIKLPQGNNIINNSSNTILSEGHPVNSFYDFKYNGIWSTAEADEAALYGALPGKIKLGTNEKVTNGVSDNGVHSYGDTDKQLLGSKNPKWIMGINNTFTYKNFDLTVFINGRWGQIIRDNLIGWYTATSSATTNQPTGIDYWTPEHQSGYFPRPGYGNSNLMKGITSLKYLDGSYLKVKNITLGYTLPKLILSKVYINSLRIYATAYNPLIYTKEKILKGTDPETDGDDTFPLYKTFVMGVNVSF
jgi:TonB-linked SusC/RagA family outer membrane protein